MLSPYDVLGVPWDADEDTIRAAFRKAAKAFHPDLNAGNEVAEQHFKQITAAREAILKDRELWAMADRHLPFDGPDAADHPEEPTADPAHRSVTLRWRLAAFGGIACAVLVASLVSSAVVLISPRAAPTAPEAPVATAAGAGTSAIERSAPTAPDTTTVATAGPVPDLRPVSPPAPAAEPEAPREKTAAEPAPDPDVAGIREDDGPWWTLLSDYRGGTWPARAEVRRSGSDKQATGGKKRSKAAKDRHPPAGTARKSTERIATPRPRPSDMAEAVAPVPHVWRPPYSRIGCWTDEGNRWLPCSGGSAGSGP
jgi:hypothetical protein